MDDNTRQVIRSNATQALTEIQAMLDHPDDPEHIRHCLGVALARLTYIQQLVPDPNRDPEAPPRR